jgi:hypothetical protein
MKSYYKRLRHTYGFGVHSPFAYDLVERVIRPGRYSYYGYQDIDDTFTEKLLPKVRREARTLLRLAAYMRPESAFIPTGIHAAYHAAVHAADSHIKVERRPHHAEESDMICTNCDFIPLEALCRAISRDNVVIAFKEYPKGWERELFASLREGVMLLGTKNLIIISHAGMQKLTYTMLV